MNQEKFGCDVSAIAIEIQQNRLPRLFFSKCEAIPNGFVFLRQKEPFLLFHSSMDVNRSHHESQIDSSDINVKYLYFICHALLVISAASAVASSALRKREVAGSSPTVT
jgi:hypothetical protein